MLKLMSHDTPNIVADNHFAQVMNVSPEYLGQNPETVFHRRTACAKDIARLQGVCSLLCTSVTACARVFEQDQNTLLWG